MKYRCSKHRKRVSKAGIGEQELGGISRFGGGVDRVEWIRRHDRGGAGADVDDGAALPLDHAWQHGVGNPGDALDVDPDQAAHELLVHLVEVARVRVRDPGVVDEHADVEAADGLLERLDARGEPLAGEVEHEGAHLGDLGALGLDLGGHRGELLRVAAHEDEPEPRGGEAEGDGAADPVGGAGDDGPGAVAAAQVLARAEEGGVDPESEADGGAGRDEEARRRERQRPGRLRLEELDVGARARHGRILELLRAGNWASRSAEMC
jgi:hypothetical protein